jgi:hypothetical protein
MGVGEYVDGAAVVDIEADMAVSLIMAQKAFAWTDRERD